MTDEKKSKIMVGVRSNPRRCMLYGVEGIGKSTFASNAPKPIFIPTEDGLDHIDCHSFSVSKSFDEFIENMTEIANGDYDYETIVIDSLDWLERLIWVEVCKDESKDNIEEIGYAKGYKFAMEYWKKVIAGLEYMRKNKGMMSILLAHSHIERFEDPTRDPYDRYSPRLHKIANSYIREWCDEVMFATYDVTLNKENEKFGKKVARAVDNGGRRVLKTQERPAHMAKNRLGMDAELEFSWESYAKYL